MLSEYVFEEDYGDVNECMIRIEHGTKLNGFIARIGLLQNGLGYLLAFGCSNNEWVRLVF